MLVIKETLYCDYVLIQPPGWSMLKSHSVDMLNSCLGILRISLLVLQPYIRHTFVVWRPQGLLILIVHRPLRITQLWFVSLLK